MSQTAPTISLCLIAKNEAANLPRLLASVREAVDEIVLVDTGSTDDTVQIAIASGAQVHHLAWNDDFAAAKNAALEQARGDWILHLDADMALEPDQPRKIREAVASGKSGAYYLIVNSPAGEGQVERVAHPWLFRNVPGARFSGAVHEQIEPQLRAAGLAPARTEIVVEHFGYMTEAARRARAERDVKILKGRLPAGETAPEVHFYLGRAYRGLERHAEAVAELRQCLAAPGAHRQRQIETRCFLADSLLILGDRTSALAMMDECARSFPDSRTVWVRAGKVHISLKQYDRAASVLNRALAVSPDANPEAGLIEVGNEVVENMLGIVYAEQKRWAQAVQHFRRAISGGLRLPDAYCNLGRAEMQSGNPPAAEQAFLAALQLDPQCVEAHTNLGLLYVAGQKYEEAVKHLDQAIAAGA